MLVVLLDEAYLFVDDDVLLLLVDDWKALDDFRTVTIGGGGGFSGFSMYLRSKHLYSNRTMKEMGKLSLGFTVYKFSDFFFVFREEMGSQCG